MLNGWIKLTQKEVYDFAKSWPGANFEDKTGYHGIKFLFDDSNQLIDIASPDDWHLKACPTAITALSLLASSFDKPYAEVVKTWLNH